MKGRIPIDGCVETICQTQCHNQEFPALKRLQSLNCGMQTQIVSPFWKTHKRRNIQTK